MYLALQHGLFVANYPLVDEDLETTDLPRPVRELRDRCFGLTTTVARLSRVRQERRPDSRYASEEQCRFELRRATAMYETHSLPTVDTSAASVEEIATVVIQTLARQRRDSAQRPEPGHDLPRGRTTRP
jgi:regulator of PEP synthase PpsR (kinase-PPPase family)